MIFDFAQMSANRVYHTMIQTLTPRPVAWVLTENENTSLNLAPFSYFNAVSSDPPLLMLSIGKKSDGCEKDTRFNIIQRSHFVVHIAHRELATVVTSSAAELPEGESELELLGLATTDFEDFALPRLSACRVAYACEKYRVEDITSKQAMILGLIKKVYIDDEIVLPATNSRLKVDPVKLDALGRLGGDDYGYLGHGARNHAT
ncbi:flavin reductase family protein [Paraglaciecola aquimarina]|uniref:Flavin reductase family protein n=1 Tax=Paraglaciecola aquimarina TaxID=1235557 RepID=A0ABU3SYP2_9ALTE|nr:flavin reductase family protein [Paraglaciecola aquimarina]MDU0355134.1 flavin reductase family protein [Paraglaciecola aquimarina]